MQRIERERMGTTIFIAEGSPLVRERLILLIEENDGMTVIGETGCARQAREQISALHPDIALLDIHLRNGNAFDVLARLRKENCQSRLVLMTEATHPGYRAKAMKLGADAFIGKTDLFELTAPVIRQLGKDTR